MVVVAWEPAQVHEENCLDHLRWLQLKQVGNLGTKCPEKAELTVYCLEDIFIKGWPTRSPF